VRAIAAVLVCLLTAIACIDPLCCSDGCERRSLAAAHSTEAGSDCPTCLSAVVPDRDPHVVRVETVIRIHDLSVPAASSLFRPDVDHPPRPV